MSTLREHLEGQSEIALTDLVKLYHGKFSYRFDLDLGKFKLTDEGHDRATFGSGGYASEVYRYRIGSAFVLEYLAKLPEDSYRTRSNTPRLFVYMADEQQAQAFFDTWKHLICEVACPRSQTDLDTLLDDAKVRIRASLYWGRYRWCLNLKGIIRHKQAQEIDTWVQEVFGKETRDLFDTLHLKLSYPSKVFFATENDAIMFRIAFSEHVSSFEKILLKKEISDVPPPSEEAD
jgi:hypothetical protein